MSKAKNLLGYYGRMKKAYIGTLAQQRAFGRAQVRLVTKHERTLSRHRKLARQPNYGLNSGKGGNVLPALAVFGPGFAAAAAAGYGARYRAKHGTDIRSGGRRTTTAGVTFIKHRQYAKKRKKGR